MRYLSQIALVSLALLSLLPGNLAAQLEMVEGLVPGTTQKWIKVYQGEIADETLLQETVYHPNDNPWKMVKYNRETATERWQWFYENENPLWAATLVDQSLQGRYQHWYENGMVAEILHFVDNIEHGPASYFYRSGQIAMEGHYEQGRMVDFTFYDQMGQPFTGSWEWHVFPTRLLRMKGAVVNGKMEGEWFYGQTADANSGDRITFHVRYENGVAVPLVN
ncbi:MAG: hypothetical protein R3307_07695 [Anaerolineales bacterium]|nr:hypothetical protein [Anaerolineales bacterium]